MLLTRIRANPATSNTLAYFALVILMGLVAASLGPTLPGLADQVGATLAGISLVFPVRSVGRMLGTYAGFVYDRFPGNPILALAAGGMVLVMLLTAEVSALAGLIVLSFILGIGQGLVDVGANALLIWTHGERVGPYMNGLHFFFGVGALIAPLIVAPLLLQPDGVADAYRLLAVLMLPAPLIVLLMPSPVAPPAPPDDAGGRINVPVVALIGLFFLLYVGAETATGGWVFTYAASFPGIDEATAAAINSLFWATFTGGRLLGVPLSARFRPRHMLMASMIGMLVSVGVLLMVPGAPGLWLGTGGVGLFMATVFPTMMAFAGRVMHLSGRATSWMFLGGVTGTTIIPWVIGLLFDSVGPVIFPLTLLVSLGAATAVFVVLLRYTARRGFSGV